jgi:DNA-binding NarL/FixJ family response regulator
MTYRTVLVDDVADIRMLVRQWLTESGDYDVVGEAANGREAVDLAASERPDLVVLDLSMPEMDGLEALPRILDVSPESAVVVLTGFLRADLADEVIDLGALACLSKSLDGRELAARMTALLEDAGTTTVVDELDLSSADG